MKRALLVVASLLLCVAATAQTTVYVVRHAEKDTKDPKNDDPGLTKAGKERAAQLAAALRSVPLTAIYTTAYNRTKDTAAPVVKQTGIKPQVPDPDGTSELVKLVLKDNKDGHVLVVGHSNTLPAILKGLGVKKRYRFKLSEYDHLFILQIAKDGKVTLTHLHYGKPTD